MEVSLRGAAVGVMGAGVVQTPAPRYLEQGGPLPRMPSLEVDAPCVPGRSNGRGQSSDVPTRSSPISLGGLGSSASLLTIKPAPRLPLFWRPPPHHPCPADDMAQPLRHVGHPHLDLAQLTVPAGARRGGH